MAQAPLQVTPPQIRPATARMNSARNTGDLLGVGIYSIGEAAALLKAKPRTIRRWMEGYGYRRGGQVRRVAPLWRPDLATEDGAELSFRDLIELRFVHAFIQIGLDLRTIRSCLTLARECVNADRPFSSARFQSDGQTIFLESLQETDDPALLDLKKSQYAMKGILRQTFKDLDIENEAVARWRPFHGKHSIVIDPARSFGQPVANDYGVPTAVLADAVEAEGSVTRAAAIFDVETSVVRDAVKYHQELAAV